MLGVTDQILPDPIMSLYRYGCMSCYGCMFSWFIHLLPICQNCPHGLVYKHTSCMQSADPGACTSHYPTMHCFSSGKKFGQEGPLNFSSKIGQLFGPLIYSKASQNCSFVWQKSSARSMPQWFPPRRSRVGIEEPGLSATLGGGVIDTTCPLIGGHRFLIDTLSLISIPPRW